MRGIPALVNQPPATPRYGGKVVTATLANDAVTYAKMQNVAATSRVIGRKTAGSGDPEECSLSDVLDFIGSAAQGDILYRGASAWSRLAAGTSGQFLKTLGAGADPAWATSSGGGDLIKLTSGTVSAAATLDIVLTGYTAYRGLLIMLSGFVPVTNAVGLYMRFSTDGGSTYDASAGNYRYTGQGTNDTPASAAFGSTSIAQIQLTGGSTLDNTSTAGFYGIIHLLNQTSTAFWSRVQWQAAGVGGGAGNMWVGTGFRATAQDTDAVRFVQSSGNISAGNYAVFGYN